ncbi:calcium-binding protein [Sphingomonas sp. VNH70]|uniref:calcium-binding protein n=1 Tax=Sphingomonas silueang TaxID=3156617 RepID=UPI0032B45DBC
MTTYTGTSGNDSWTITPADGSSSVDGGEGTDTLTVDWSTSTDWGYFYYYANGYGYGYASSANGLLNVSLQSIERLNLTFGSGNDDFYHSSPESDGSATIANVNGGGGIDTFHGNYALSNANITFVLKANGAASTVTGIGDVLTNFEAVDITTGSGNDSLTGGDGNDILRGGSGNNVLTGGGGNDQLYTDFGTDTVSGGDGDDTIYTNNGRGTVDGGAGFDTWNGNFSQATTGLTMTRTASGYSLSNGMTLTGIERTNVTGTDFNDSFVGVDSGSYDGLGGTDTLTVDWSTSTDWGYFYYYANGYGYGYASSANGSLNVFTNNIERLNLTFGSGNDDFYHSSPESGGSATIANVNGGGGIDTFHGDYTASSANITFVLKANGAASTVTGIGDVLTNFEAVDISAGSGNDSLTGGDGNDILRGGSGNNVLTGGGGNDQLYTDFGTDTVSGGDGDDDIYTNNGLGTVDGGAGYDRWSGDFSQATTGLTMTRTASGYSLSNGMTLTGIEQTNVGGTSFNDSFVGVNSGYYDGRDGTDALTFDWSSGTETDYFSYYGSGYGSGYNYSTGGSLSINSIERLNLTFGSGDNRFYHSTSDSNGVATIANVDGGAGIDRFYGEYGQSSANISFVLKANGAASTVTGIGDTLTNFEQVDITTGSGNDSLTGGDGNDILRGGGGTNVLNGGGGNDTLYTDFATDTVSGGDGDDTIYTNNGLGTVDGGDGFDVWYGNFSQGATGITMTRTASGYTLSNGMTLTGIEQTNVTGTNFNDSFAGTSGSFSGLDGTDTLTVDWSSGTETDYFYYYEGAYGNGYSYGTNSSIGISSIERLNLTFGSGDNRFYRSTSDGTDRVSVDGGTGIDRFDANYTLSTANITFVLNAGGAASTVAGIGDVLTNFESVGMTTGSGNDSLIGGAGNDYFAAGAGNDYVEGRDGDDQIDGGEGSDTLSYASASSAVTVTLQGQNYYYGVASGGGGFDTVANFENLMGSNLNDTLTGDGGNNIIEGLGGNDTLVGGLGTDTASYANALGGVTVSLALTTAQNTGGAGIDTLSGFENLTGSAYNDVLTGNDGFNLLSGLAGDDILSGGVGSDTLDGGEGVDIASYASASGAVAVNLTITVAQNTGSSGNDTLVRIEGLIGSAYNDTLTGNAGANLLDGGGGADNMAGGLGNDTYVVDNAGDVVTEAANAGTDTVQSSIAYTLGANVENLTLTGTANIDGTGNALANVVTGNGGNNVLDGGTGADTLAGGLGNDTYMVDNAGDTVSENAGEGYDIVYASVGYALSANVERLNLTGTANIDGTGNALANVLVGNSGDNVLDGGAGEDILQGGQGNDTYIVDAAGDSVTENAGEGTDSVRASVGYVLSANVENLTLTGAANINGTGNTLANVIIGNSGNNVLDGGAGADSLAGGLGNDTYVIDNAGDTVTELAGEGIDTVQSSIGYVIGANVENLTLTGTANLSGTGNALANVLTGNGGNNVLDGGAGADTLVGGAGDDSYIVDNTGDIVTESSGQGTDTVRSAVSYALSANVENLVLTGTANLTGFGNTLANTLTGNAGNNVLDGYTGADTMIGGLGNDTYVVDNAGDLVVENAGEGTDTVQSAMGYILGANVENLTLTGAANVNGYGNALANVLTGNSGNNYLDGGAGADAMQGGAGNDIYVVDNAGDVVTENAGEGNDLVLSAISYTLGANVEWLNLTGWDENIDGTGNALDNVLTGNNGNNVLDGGAGQDALIGGMGNDTYVVDNVGDVVTEAAGEGTDTVRSSVAFALGANVENLILTGTADIDGTGNGLANVLTGNAGNNILDGGVGADTLAGGLGDDSYVVDDAGDTVTENAGEGTDTVRSSIAHTLGANLENLTLTGSAAINGTGNALANVLTGNSGNNVLDGGAGADTLRGGAGDDSYIVDDAGDAVIENAGEGIDTVRASVTYTLGANIENLILTGSAANGTGNALDNVLTGNAAANTLLGLDGNDTLDGGAGADTLNGGAGNDTYVVDNSGDTIVEAAGGGTDTVRASISYSLSGQQLENLVLTGTANLNATGNGMANSLTGNSGNNVLDGLVGADTMAGGLGNDTYVVDNAGDVVIEAAGEGTDSVQASITYTLGANVENLVLTGTAAISAFGNALANSLTGNAANNTLDGGAGDDVMAGGLGDDRYFVDSVGDRIVEANNAGTDTVLASVSYSLAGQFLENLTLTGTANLNATGNGLANVITGNAGNNVIDGGFGNDVMAGGLGDDTYYVDSTGDVVQEANNAGNDTVLSWVSYTLAGSFIENLTLLGQLTNTNATGNSLNNVLTGSGGNNIIDGGLGADTMIGGNGDDIYYVDNSGDIVVENASQGTDTVISSVGFTLAGSHIENLTLTGSLSTYANGNGLDNVLVGNAGANTMNARGGADLIDGGLGADILTGEAGADSFRFSTALGNGNVDTITDFTVADDTILLDDAVFAAAGSLGTLAAGAFRIGTAAQDADDRILYDSATGALYYDADGNGAGAAVQFATIGTGLALTHADFVVI